MDSQLDRSSFEVFCARCNVTFPVETKKCVHCGGPTHASRPAGVDFDRESFQVSHAETGGGSEPRPIDYTSPESLREAALPQNHPESHPEHGEIVLEEPPASIGRSIIRSLGGFIWVLLLIGFSLVRSCEE